MNRREHTTEAISRARNHVLGFVLLISSINADTREVDARMILNEVFNSQTTIMRSIEIEFGDRNNFINIRNLHNALFVEQLIVEAEIINAIREGQHHILDTVLTTHIRIVNEKFDACLKEIV